MNTRVAKTCPAGRRRHAWTALATALLVAGTAHAGTDACTPGAPVPLGPEFRINTTTDNLQNMPNVVATASGGFHVVWKHTVALYFDPMHGQRFSANGTPIGSEIDYDDSFEDTGLAMGVYASRPALLALPQDELQLAWSGVFWERTAPTTWTRRDSIVTRRYAGDGTRLSGYLSVPTTFVGQPVSPGIAGGQNMGFVITWSGSGPGDSNGTFRRLFDSESEPTAEIARVNTTTTDGQFQPRVAAARFGNHVVVWRGNGPGDAQGIFMQRFDAAGVPLSGETRVNVTTAGTQATPDVAMHGNGRFVVVWDGNGPGDDMGVFARRYTAAGTPLGDEIAINVTTTGNQVRPSVAVMPDGGFVVARSGNGPGDETGVFLRRFDAHGTPHADELLVNTTSTGGQIAPAVAVAPGGEIMVTWEGNGPGDNLGIFGRVYARPGNVYRAGFESPDDACVP